MLKKIGLTLAGILFVLLTAALVIPYFVPAEEFKRAVTGQAEKLIGHPLAINGALRLKLFPYVGVYMENVVIGSRSRGQMPLASFKSMNIDVDALAALGGNVRIKSMTLDSPVIHLIVDANGKRNWMPETPEKSAGENVGEKEEAADTDENHAGMIRNMSLEDVHLINGDISYRNILEKKGWRLTEINLGVALSGIAMPFKLTGNIIYNDQPISFDATLETLQTFLSTRQANIAAELKNELITVSFKGKLDDMRFTGPASITTPSLVQTIGWMSDRRPKAGLASPLPLKLTSDTDCSYDACAFTNAVLKLDTIEAKGDVKAAFTGPVPRVDLRLDTNVLDFNLFIPEEEKAARSGWMRDAYAAESDWDDTPIDFSILHAIELVANIHAQGIKIKQVHMGKTTLRAKIQRGRLSADVIDADLYGGKLNALANVDVSTGTPITHKRVSLSGVQMEPLLKNAEITDRFSGKTDFEVSLASKGDSVRAMVANMQGSGSMKVLDGSIKGVDIAGMVRNLQSAFKGTDTGPRKTDFTEAGGTFSVERGIVSNHDLVLKAPLLRLTGDGTVDLPLQTIHYRLSPQIVQTIQGQGGKEKQGIGVPVIVEGSLEHPTFRPDIEGVAKEAIRNPEKLKEQLKNSKETLKGLKEQLKENKAGLKNLLKGF